MTNRILVDSKEPQKIKDMFIALDIKHKVKNLPIGDFVCNNVCIERKTMPDLIGSIRSQHLQKQLLQMQDNYKRCFLIISGSYKQLIATGEAIKLKTGYNPYKGWTVEHHCGTLASIGARYPKIQMIQVDNDTQLIKVVNKLIMKCFDGKVKTYLDTEIMTVKDKFGIEDTKLVMLKSIPAVGLERALFLRKHISLKLTTLDGKCLTEDYLYSIHGMGPTIIKKLLKINKDA